jgi:cardiolipin synthase (CMP-forming)
MAAHVDLLQILKNMEQENKQLLNVPNVLSAYRILALPFITWSIASGNKQLFITLLSINLISDILDGFIARRFKLETEFGARLDSLADVGTYIMAFSGMIVLESAFVREHAIAFCVTMVMYAVPQIIALVRFQRTTSFHLYSSKITGYLQGIFIFTYFIFGYSPVYFYVMIVVSCIAYTEALILVLFLRGLRSNVKGLYWVIRSIKEV